LSVSLAAFSCAAAASRLPRELRKHTRRGHHRRQDHATGMRTGTVMNTEFNRCGMSDSKKRLPP
jgi:hypothetical protein